MITVTLGEVIDRTATEVAGPVIYVVRDLGTVFYVGCSRQPISRLENHLSRYGGGNSELGIFARDNEPRSRAWIADIYPPELFGSADPFEAERRAIALFRPWLNRQYGFGPCDLPLQYRTHRLNQYRRLLDFAAAQEIRC
jgi:hypothetical protein